MHPEPEITPRPHPWYTTEHHRPGEPRGFRNVWGAEPEPPVRKALGWIVSRSWRRSGPAARTPFQPLAPETLAPPARRARVSWLGHSSCLIQTGSHTILTDPQFGERASPLSFAGPKRESPLPLSPERLPPVSIVLLSHNHYDHLDVESLRLVERRFGPIFLVPLGLAAPLRGWGLRRVVEFDWWQFAEVEGLTVHCTPARHFSSRSLFDRDRTLWASWYLADERARLYFGADSGYAGHFRSIRERLGAPDVAMLPIGAYLPRWFMARVHMDPEESVRAFLDLEAGHFIPIHWGTFDLADEPMDAPPAEARSAALRAGIPPDRFHLLPVGGVFEL